MSLHSFIVTAYKPESATGSMQCITEQWAAQYEAHYNLGLTEAVALCVRYLTQVLDAGEEGFHVTLTTIKDDQFVVYAWGEGYHCSVDGDDLDDLVCEIDRNVRTELERQYETLTPGTHEHAVMYHRLGYARP